MTSPSVAPIVSEPARAEALAIPICLSANPIKSETVCRIQLKTAEKTKRLLGGWVEGLRVRMEDEENMVWSAFTSLKSPHREEQQVVASVEVTLLQVALILLLVDPIDDVVMAILRRIPSATASAPRARRFFSP